MSIHRGTVVVGIFEDRTLAQRAVAELKKNGFRDDQIGVAGRLDEGEEESSRGLADLESQRESRYTGEGAVAGAAAGAGIGALWGLGIMAGVMPPLGVAIAGGTLAAILSSAATGAAAAGVAGALVGMGIPRDEADYYEAEFKSGRTILSVNAGERDFEASSILRQCGAYDSSARDSSARELATTSKSTSTPADHMVGASFSSTESQTGSVETNAVESEHHALDVPVHSADVPGQQRAGSGP